MQAGRMRHRVRIEREVLTPVGGGASDLSWSTLLSSWVGFRPQFGGEQVKAGNLTSTLTGTITIRTSAAARGITPDDRCVFIAGPHTGTICNIRSILPLEDRIEMTLESGVAT